MQLWTPNQPLKNGRFIVEKVLGGGGFGVTYSALEQRTGKLFAIKTLNPIQQSQGDFHEKQEQFVNEALRLRGCQHPHIVKVHEVIQEVGLWGMVMEYVNGDDLGVYVDKHGHLSEDETLRYINQVGQALECVHQQGFLHRDIKPNNIILRDAKQEAVLIDFGLARKFTIGKTLSMTNSKTEGYAPVEQYERQGRFGTYTDVYALAATLYSLLTGRIPIPANYRKDGDIPLKAPKQFNSDISDRVNNAIIKGMALEPQDRSQTGREWLELLNPKSHPRQQIQEIQNLKSSKMDYTRLRDFLAAGKWKEADQETDRVMLAVTGRENWFDYKSIPSFPCEDLRIIDQLWVKYSNRHFGFSVQNRIYQSLGGTRHYDEKIWKGFGDRVGWRNRGNGNWIDYNDYVFDMKAPLAHLPANFSIKGDWGYSARSSIASRLVDCNI
ncbi:MAG: GUN4 domain-containing protein [Nostoc sp. NMS7]|uniref:serine/threonine-protein kinase n=1 Tax=Nostoc sp. NMS7 TaxID=2815391 RepID=UPI0025DC32DF|nr:serine/threonine-protein kinase [Nostoc sp. NMS7]MBN3945612.1 GUN4 domain-containing protein [Nostoc sp. NMS7]